MKKISIMLAFILLLTGCTHAPAPTIAQRTETTVSQTPNTTVVQETTVPETTPAEETTSTETQPTETTAAPTIEEILLDTMTVEEKVGQLLLARCPDINAIEDISAYHLGGYILFGRDFDNETPDTVKAKLKQYQSAATIPLLIAVDEEGGTVCRVSNRSAFRSTRFPSPRKLYESGGLAAITTAEEEKCQLLHDLGINVNMAPVCDVTTDPNAFMYSRSLGESPEVTGAFIQNTVAVMSQYQVGSVLKHFPGYGNNTDTHTGIATDTRSLETLESVDLFPFAAGIALNCDAILVSHTIVTCLDEEFPASLSTAVHAYLREEMGFDGVIVTDDLIMEAITQQYGAGEAAVLAVLAGNDLLCSTEYHIAYEAILKAVQEGRISAELLDQAVLRLLRWKAKLGLL